MYNLFKVLFEWEKGNSVTKIPFAFLIILYGKTQNKSRSQLSNKSINSWEIFKSALIEWRITYITFVSITETMPALTDYKTHIIV
jgi:hypothetical protein